MYLGSTPPPSWNSGAIKKIQVIESDHEYIATFNKLCAIYFISLQFM